MMKVYPVIEVKTKNSNEINVTLSHGSGCYYDYILKKLLELGAIVHIEDGFSMKNSTVRITKIALNWDYLFLNVFPEFNKVQAVSGDSVPKIEPR